MIVLETERLVLRHVEPGDCAALEALFCDEEVMCYSDGLLTPDEVRAWVDHAICVAYPEWGFGPWAVVEREGGAVIGYCGLTQYSGRSEAGEAELGFRLARSCWERGYATEAAGATCTHGLGEFGLARIVAIVDPGNEASVRVLHKLGMRCEREIMFEHYNHPDHVYLLDRA